MKHQIAADLQQHDTSPLPLPKVGGLRSKHDCGKRTLDGDCNRCKKKRGNLSHSALKPLVIQPKFAISKPKDFHEEEANRIAKQVLNKRTSQPANDSQAQVSYSRESGILIQPGNCKGTTVSRKFSSNIKNFVDPNLTSKIQERQSKGRPLSAGTKRFFESRFGRDFSNIRVHTDNEANAMTRSVNAHAFTYRKDIYFAKGKFNEESDSGRELLAHELVHTIQQTSPSSVSIQRQIDEEGLNRDHQQPTETDVRESSGPTIGPVPIDQLRDITVIDFPPIPNLVPRYSLPNEFRGGYDSGRINILNIPIEFGSIQAGGALRARAKLEGGIGPVGLHHIRAALNQEQLREYYSPTRLFGIIGPRRFANFHPARPHNSGEDLGAFVVEADLIVPADLRLVLFVEGSLEAAATVLGFDLTTLGAGINAGAIAEVANTFRVHGQYMYRDGKLDIDQRFYDELIFRLGYSLRAFLEVSFLGFEKRYDWELAQGNLSMQRNFSSIAQRDFTRNLNTPTSIGILTDRNGNRRFSRYIDLRNLPDYLRQINQVVDEIFGDNQIQFHESNAEATGGSSEPCLPRSVIPYVTRNRHRRPGPDSSNPYDVDGGDIDPALLYKTLAKRKEVGIDPEAVPNPWHRNIAVGKIWVDGLSRPPIAKVNEPGAAHSEVLIMEEMRRIRNNGHHVQLTQLYSERIPCGSARRQKGCSYFLNRDERNLEVRRAKIWFGIPFPDFASRTEELRSIYCLIPPPRRPRTEPLDTTE